MSPFLRAVLAKYCVGRVIPGLPDPQKKYWTLFSDVKFVGSIGVLEAIMGVVGRYYPKSDILLAFFLLWGKDYLQI